MPSRALDFERLRKDSLLGVYIVRYNRDMFQTKAFHPKGYFTNDGYVGFLPDGRRVYFPTYSEYLEYIAEEAAA